MTAPRSPEELCRLERLGSALVHIDRARDEVIAAMRGHEADLVSAHRALHEADSFVIRVLMAMPPTHDVREGAVR